jgi:diguanylate cyclase (GGDEF)-like protein
LARVPWTLWALRRLPVGLLVTDLSGRVRWTNDRVVPLLGADPAGRDLTTLFTDREHASLTDYVEQVVTGRPPVPGPRAHDGNGKGHGQDGDDDPTPGTGTGVDTDHDDLHDLDPDTVLGLGLAADDDPTADTGPRTDDDTADADDPTTGSGSDEPGFLGTVYRPDGSTQRVRLTGIRYGRWVWSRLVHVVAPVADQDVADEIVREALTDELTGLPSRVLFITHLKAVRESRRSQAVPGPGALALVNLDAFRRINDLHGHLVGDQVLRAVADRLVLSLPRNVVVARLAGDEFGVLLPTHTPEEAAQLLERVAAAVAAQPLRHANVPVAVQLSAGVTGLDGRYVDTVLAQADRALTHAKANRDGRCAVFGAGDGVVPTRRELYEHLGQLAAENSRLERTTLTDHLTGLPNTRALDQALDELDSSHRGHGAEYSLLFVDLDRFGAYNKTHGDSAGDRALRAVAQTLRDNCRQGETVFRKGGEELVVVLPGCGREAAARVGERLRRAVEELALPHGGHPDTPVVTVTVAVATVQADFTAHELMDHASRGAFATKIARRRNRVVVTDPPAATRP